MLHDTNGFSTPFADHDAVIECGCIDPDHGEPGTWPAWTDADRWEPGPEMPDDRFEPTPDDRKWWAEVTANNEASIAGSPPVHHEPTDQDWDEMARWSEQVFGPPRGVPITDEDVAIATGCAG